METTNDAIQNGCMASVNAYLLDLPTYQYLGKCKVDCHEKGSFSFCNCQSMVTSWLLICYWVSEHMDTPGHTHIHAHMGTCMWTHTHTEGDTWDTHMHGGIHTYTHTHPHTYAHKEACTHPQYVPFGGYVDSCS